MARPRDEGRRDRRSSGWAAALAPLLTLVSGCGVLEPMPHPPPPPEAGGPTPLAQPGEDVWVEWENRTEDAYALTMSGRGGVVAYGEVRPCVAHGMGMTLEAPFSIGITPWRAEITQPGPEVANHRDWAAAGGEYLLVIIDEDGVHVSTTPEQRASDGMCP